MGQEERYPHFFVPLQSLYFSFSSSVFDFAGVSFYHFAYLLLLAYVFSETTNET